MRKVIVILFLLIIIAGAWIAWMLFGPTINNPDKKFLYIPSNASYQQVKDSLKKNDMLTSFYWFDKLANYTKLPVNIKPGKYKVTNEMSLYHLVKKLRSGNQEPVNLVITKLRTKEDLAKRIGKLFETDSAKAIAFLNNNDSLQKFAVDSNTVLTDVIPNTYTYTWTSSVDDIFQKLYREHERFWNKERLSKAQQHGLSPAQAYILASIVEEETNKNDDKGKIASVYLNRLRKGMRLAADPTIKFALKNFTLTRIYHKYLDVSSPYNTYRNAGLPPGPICTPSIKTLDAVLNAPETDYLFFVAKADFSGYSNFATNYTQHQIFANEYRLALDSLVKRRQEKEAQDSLTE